MPPPPRGGPARGLAILAGLVAVLVLLGAGIGLGWAVLGRTNLIGSPSSPGVEAPIRPAPQHNGGTGSQNPNADAIASKVTPAIVDVNTVLASSGGQTQQAAGTGIIITPGGEVLTNNHVIQGATSIKVTVQGRSESYNATVLGESPSADVALIQIQGVSGLPTAQLASSSNLSVGQPVVAIGNALGQGGAPSVTQGSITALDQSITASDGGGRSEQLTGLIQSDAPIISGDSGGPLVNSAGQVIGMITAGESSGRRQTTSSNVGYAIPVSNALNVVNQIRAGKASSNVIIGLPGFLGVDVQSLDAATANQLGINATSGALVAGVVQGSPADQAGIARDAVITAIDGQTINSADALGPAIQSHKPGQQIKVTWVDQGGTHSATVTLASGPAA